MLRLSLHPGSHVGSSSSVFGSSSVVKRCNHHTKMHQGHSRAVLAGGGGWWSQRVFAFAKITDVLSVNSVCRADGEKIQVGSRKQPHPNKQVNSGQLVALTTSNMNKTGDSLMRTSWFTHPSDTTETTGQEINLTFIRQRCCNEVIIRSVCFFWERWEEFESGKYSRAADN